MRKRTFCMSLMSLLLSGCNRDNYSGFIILTEDNTSVRFNIPKQFLHENIMVGPKSSVWLSFSYPDMTPTKRRDKLANDISLLIVNIANRKTRAEYLSDVQKVSFDNNSNTDVEKCKTVIKEIGQNNKNEAEATRYIYKRTRDGYIICYKIIQRLKISASRRYSKNIELRYVIPEALFDERDRVESAIATLVNTFKDKS